MAAVPALSYSGVRAYLECPLRWKFLYIDRIPETPRSYFSFGRTVHAVLEELLRPLVIPSARVTSSGASQRTLDDWGERSPSGTGLPGMMTADELLATYERLWVAEGYGSSEEENRYRRLGRELLLGYREEVQRTPPTPVAIEEHLQASWGGIPIHGYIDRIDRTPTGGFEVLDYKTTRELSHIDAAESDQLSLYQVLVEKNYSGPVEHLTLYHLRSQTPLRVPKRPTERLELLYGRVGQVSDGIRSEAYEPTPGRHCNRCEFKSRCPEFREIPEMDRPRLGLLVDRFAQLRTDEHQLDRELELTAKELHQEAERLGVHRLPGSREVVIRRVEEEWQFAPERISQLLATAGIAPVGTGLGSDQVRAMIRDPSIDPELRRKLAETGTRRVHWYWEIERDSGY
jgi:putative RecB family exonuclease